MTRELQNTSNQLQQSQEIQNKSMEELDMMAAQLREYEEREGRGIESRDEMERELDAKDELVSNCHILLLLAISLTRKLQKLFEK